MFNKWVFRRRLKVARDSECLIWRGRAFHIVGAATLKDLPPVLLYISVFSFMIKFSQNVRCVLKWYQTDLLLRSEPRTMRESSIRPMSSPTVSPLSKSSPRFLKWPNFNSWFDQSAITCFNFASMSVSFVALMQISLTMDEKKYICS